MLGRVWTERGYQGELQGVASFLQIVQDTADGEDVVEDDAVGDEVIVLPTVDPVHVTPHTESFQAVIWHCLISHPDLMLQDYKWEGLLGSGKSTLR